MKPIVSTQLLTERVFNSKSFLNGNHLYQGWFHTLFYIWFYKKLRKINNLWSGHSDLNRNFSCSQSKCHDQVRRWPDKMVGNVGFAPLRISPKDTCSYYNTFPKYFMVMITWYWFLTISGINRCSYNLLNHRTQIFFINLL